jgi:ADP-ribosyl-[dinitrogen reductase] hydrolase
MIGAIAGDIIGSIYEFDNIKTKKFPLFGKGSTYTDDSIMTIAVADWLLHGGNLVKIMQYYGRKYPSPMGGYGGRFGRWLSEIEPKAYNSWGNGAAMRVSPVGWCFDSLEETLKVARNTAIVTHDHPEGIKGAQATATAIFLARNGKTKEFIKEFIEALFGYDLNRSCDDIRPYYKFDESCQGTVPEAIIAFLESDSYEDAIRLAVSLGGDSDTLACIAGGIAEAFYIYQMPYDIVEEVCRILDVDLLKIVEEFRNKYRGLFVHPRWSDPGIVSIVHYPTEEEKKQGTKIMCDDLVDNIEKMRKS